MDTNTATAQSSASVTTARRVQGTVTSTSRRTQGRATYRRVFAFEVHVSQHENGGHGAPHVLWWGADGESAHSGMMDGGMAQHTNRPGESQPIGVTVDRRDCIPWCATGMPRAFRYAFSRMNSSTSLTPDGGGTTLPCARHHGHHHHGGNRTAVVSVTTPRHLRSSHTLCSRHKHKLCSTARCRLTLLADTVAPRAVDNKYL